MTAIARFCCDGILFVVGDLAISGSAPIHDTSLPSIGDVTPIFMKGTPYMVRGAMQKVVICHERLVLGWAGTLIAARALIREIAALTEPTLEEIESIVSQQDDSPLTEDLEIIGWHVAAGTSDDDRPVTSFHIKGRVFTSGPGTPLCCGTGGTDLLQAIELVEAPDSGEAPTELLPILEVLMATGNLMLSEVTSESPLLTFFGGGYEIAIWDGTRFIKLELAVHVFWEVKAADEHWRIRPVRIIRPLYNHGALIVNAAEGDLLGDGSRQLSQHVVGAPHRPGTSDDALIPPRFGGASFVLNHVIRVSEDDQVIAMACRLDGGSRFTVIDTDAGPKLSFSDEVRTAFLEFAVGALSDSAHRSAFTSRH